MTIVRRARGTHAPRGRGQTLVEFALVLPIFLLILMSLLDFGRIVYAQHTINQDAAEGARVGAVSADGLVTSAEFTARYAKIRAAAQLMAPAVPMNNLTTVAASIKGAPGACAGATGTPAMPNDGSTAACFYPNGVNNVGLTTPPKIVVSIAVKVDLITPIISFILPARAATAVCPAIPAGSICLTATNEQLLQ